MVAVGYVVNVGLRGHYAVRRLTMVASRFNGWIAMVDGRRRAFRYATNVIGIGSRTYGTHSVFIRPVPAVKTAGYRCHAPTGLFVLHRPPSSPVPGRLALHGVPLSCPYGLFLFHGAPSSAFPGSTASRISCESTSSVGSSVLRGAAPQSYGNLWKFPLFRAHIIDYSRIS
jgi:hypothetical protein